MTRSADVLTYVEQGVADVGVTGKDTILEYGAGMSFYERLDLNIGLCRMMTAAPAGFVPEPGVLSGSVKVRQYCAQLLSWPELPGGTYKALWSDGNRPHVRPSRLYCGHC